MSVATAPASDVDLFAHAILDDPWQAYAALRDAGPVVWLERYDAWAISRYEDVFRVLRDHETYSSAPFPALEPERPDVQIAYGSILGTDPPRHTALRAVLSTELSPRALRGLREQIARQADEVVAGLVASGSFDAVQDLARRLPVEIVAELIGLPLEARESLLELADAAFNMLGPVNDLTEGSWDRLPKIGEYVADAMSRERIAPGSWGATIYEAIDSGEITEAEGDQLLRGFIVAGMDTTVNSIGSAIWLLAERPGDWVRLRADPGLAASAFEEALRYESPVSFTGRRTTRPTEVGGVAIEADAQVVLWLSSANRDDRHYEAADTFRLDRYPVDHVAFGGGVHSCAGQGLARVEGPAVLAALARHAGRIELAGEPERHLNNAVRGLGRLPVVVTPSGAA